MSGDGRGRPDARLARRGGSVELLRGPAALFGAVARARAWLYEHGVLRSHRLQAPVVCVGNLTVGGTGKTPFVALLARDLDERGLRVGLLSRGYRSAGDAEAGGNDEARLLADELPGVPHVQDADRVRGGRALVEGGADVVLCDDGFQHLRLARDLDLVLIDATRPWGLPPGPDGGAPVRAMLPRGFLREPLRALRRAQAVVLTRSDQAGSSALAELEAEIGEAAPGVPVLLAEHRASMLRAPDGEMRHPTSLRGVDVDLASGIGNPESFERTVVELGARVHEHRAFGDHHAFAAGDLAGLGEGERVLLVTAKDHVKLAEHAPHAHVLTVRMEITRGASILEALLDSLRPSRNREYRDALHEGLHG